MAGTIRVDLLIKEARARARRRRLKTAAALVVVTGGVVVVLVSSLTFTSNARAALPNPCALLSNTQAGSAMRAKVAWKQELQFPNTRGRTCQWTSVGLTPATNYAPAIRRQLTVMVGTLSRAEFLEGAEANPGVQRVVGVGELAYRLGGGALKELNVWQSGVALMVVTGDNVDIDALPAEKAAAHAALVQLSR